jgi:hypothetical protein
MLRMLSQAEAQLRIEVGPNADALKSEGVNKRQTPLLSRDQIVQDLPAYYVQARGAYVAITCMLMT